MPPSEYTEEEKRRCAAERALFDVVRTVDEDGRRGVQRQYQRVSFEGAPDLRVSSALYGVLKPHQQEAVQKAWVATSRERERGEVCAPSSHARARTVRTMAKLHYPDS